MYILDFQFDFSWFLTIPGMLITGGVLLLIIALVIFIATSGSSKGKKKGKKTEEPVVAPTLDTPSVTMVSNGAEMVPSGIPPVQTPQEVTPPVAMPEVPAQAPIVEPEVPTEAVPNMNEVPTAPVAPTVEETSTVTPPVNDVLPQKEVEQPVVDIQESVATQEPAVTVPSETATEATMPIPKVEEISSQPSVSIYGGASPEVPTDLLKDDLPHQIYGGANPTDNTQTIPVVNHDMEYGEPVKKVEPVIEEKESPKEEGALPTVDPTIPVAPTTPVEPVSEESKVEEQKEEPTEQPPKVEEEPIEVLDF